MRATSEIGDLAEVLVNYQLAAAGLAVFFPSASHLPYDLLVDVAGGRFLRIQVKGSLAPRVQRGVPSQGYIFNSVGSSRNRRSRGEYKADDFDWFAFAALDREQVLYVPAADIIAKSTKQESILISRFENEAAASLQALLDDAARVREGLIYCQSCSRLSNHA